MTKRPVFVSLVILAIASIGSVQRVQGAASLWQTLVPGIEYREFYLSDPNHIYVARMERANPQLALESGIGQGSLVNGAETVRDMAARYDQAINYWGSEWGNRNQVVVGINGFFYDSETGLPFQGQVQSGWYMKRFDDRQNVSGIAWTLDRNIFIAGCVVHPPAKQFITHLRSGERLAFDGINVPRGENDLILYSHHYDRSTHTESDGIEVLVELDSPLLILPEPAMVTGVVRAIRDGLGDTPIPFDHIVLSGSGELVDQMRQMFQVGDQIGNSQEMKQYESDCRTPAPGGWERTYAAVGGSFVFLQEGVVKGFDDLGALLRSPRTVVAYNDRYIYFIVVDGRDRFNSQGMSMVEMAVFAKTQLDVVWGVALDGGGSSTMVVNGQVKNQPNIELSLQPQTGDPDQRPITERVVGNSLMMVLVQPREASGKFSIGDQVTTTRDVELHLGPGTNYSVLTTMPANIQGVILEHANDLNGVLAKGSYWWKVAFGEVTGWLQEDGLVGRQAD